MWSYSVSNQQLEMTYSYCKMQGIPFPKIELSEEDKKNPKECYMFLDEENPRAPIVLHFPLVNNTFQEYKEPGKFIVNRKQSFYCTFSDQPFHI